MNAVLVQPSSLDPAEAFGLCLGWRRTTLSAKSGERVQANNESARAAKPRPEELAEWLDGVVKRQDREAFARLHIHFAPRIAAWMARAGMNPAQIEDIVQDCMVAVWNKAHLYDAAHGGVTTWIFAIARNLRIDHSRRKANREMLPLDDWDDADDQPDSESRLITSESETLIRRALEQLPGDQKQVLMHAYFADKPHSTIAQELGLPLGTVKSRLRLGLSKLRMLMENPR